VGLAVYTHAAERNCAALLQVRKLHHGGLARRDNEREEGHGKKIMKKEKELVPRVN
jgi:hypothetical protein